MWCHTSCLGCFLTLSRYSYAIIMNIGGSTRCICNGAFITLTPIATSSCFVNEIILLLIPIPISRIKYSIDTDYTSFGFSCLV